MSRPIITNINFNLQFFFSYLGLCPFILTLFDFSLFSFFSTNLLKDFIIFYSLIILTFIGAMRWSFSTNMGFIKIIYVFIPSLFSTILIFLNLLNFQKDLILFTILLLLLFQLGIDLSFKNVTKFQKIFIYYARLPITLAVSLSILYLILV